MVVESRSAVEAVREAIADTMVDGRLLLARDLTMRSLTHQATSLSNDGGTEAPVPVALFELPIIRSMALEIGGPLYALDLAIAAKLGLPRFRAGVPPEVASNWVFRDTSFCELVDPTGSVVARFQAEPDLQWRNAARERGTVAVLYGGELGVRRPAGITARHYSIRRDAELHRSLESGSALGGFVAYSPS